MARKWLRYGLVGNTLFFGGGFASIGYLLWIIFDVTDKSTKMDQDLAKQLFSTDFQKKAQNTKNNKKVLLKQKIQGESSTFTQSSKNQSKTSYI